MNIQKRLQIEFEFLGDEQISANAALNIINNVFKEAENEQLTLGSVGSSRTDKKRYKHKYENKYFAFYYNSKTEIVIESIALAFFVVGVTLIINSFK